MSKKQRTYLKRAPNGRCFPSSFFSPGGDTLQPESELL